MRTRFFFFALAAPSAVAIASAQSNAPSIRDTTTKPAWLTDVSLGVKESYDDNVLSVSGNSLPEQSSWVNTVSLKVGVDLAPVLASGGAIQTFSLVYQPDRVTYAQHSEESYTAHRFNTTLKGKSGAFTFSLDNAFLYNDGDKLAPTYALNQLSGAAADQNDKYRNNYAHGTARERRNQIQDRYTILVQYNTGNFFVRPVSSLIFYNLNTDLFNTSSAPYKGYQDYIDRYDLNGGVDLGYKLVPGLAFTLGYRDGHQHQDRFSPGINSDQHSSSNNYQRVLAGLEGKPAGWLSVKLAAGPDFRDFNPSAPISDLHTTRFYGEATATATLPENQSLTFNFKQWVFVSSTGLVPYDDITYSLAYHWNATRQLGFDLGAKYLEGNYTLGNDIAGSAPSLRDDLEYEASAGVSYTIIPHLIASATYVYDDGRNGLRGLAQTYAPAYRNFKRQVVGLGLQYRF
jgi:hypothetical protein